MLSIWPEWCVKMFTYTGMLVWAAWVLFFLSMTVMAITQSSETDKEYNKRMKRFVKRNRKLA